MKGRILHLEDDQEWLENIRSLLKGYDLYQATSVQDAARILFDLAASSLKCDLVIVDISLVFADAHDKGGFRFIDALENAGVLPGQAIIMLSAYPEVDDNMRTAFRKYKVHDVFDKGNFVEEKDDFLERIAEVIE